MKKIAIFASGNGTNAENIIRYFADRRHNIEVSMLVSDNAQSKVIEKASRLDIKTVVFTKTQLKEEPEKLLSILKPNDISFIVLAGFLSYIPDIIVENYNGRIVNIHPSLLPKFGGKGMYGDNVHKAVIEAGEAESGITIHYVDPIYDNGGIIFQKSIKLSKGESAESLAQKIHGLEYRYYPEIIAKII